MPESSNLASQIAIKINQTDVSPEIISKLISVMVDQHTHLPNMFTIRFQDTDLSLLDDSQFNLTKSVEISAENASGEKTTLMKGEITALEPEFKEGMIAELVVRGYDKSHRLYRETKSKAYVNAKDSDLATQIAQTVGLQAEVEPTPTVYNHIFQHNQSDLEFLTQRAWRIGYECFISEDKLHFRKPPRDEARLTLTWGSELSSFFPRITLAEQVDEVIVKGWDWDKQEAIVGKANKGKLYPKTDENKDGAQWAQEFGSGKMVFVDQSVISQAEADALAAARLDEISGSFIEAEGSAFRCPQITAGKTIKLEGLGQRFSGTYLVTNATHLFTEEGLKTTFSVRGSRTGLLTEQVTHTSPIDRWHGVVIGIVTNTDDPKNAGRVKVKFPWLSEDVESDWARVSGFGAGNQAGLFILPAVGDEVLVIFAHGDFSQPYVLGAVWNGQSSPPSETTGAASGEKPLVRTWRSKEGHRITVYDNADKKIEIITKDGRTITLDDAKRMILLETPEVKVKMENNGLTIDSDMNITIKAGANLNLEASGQVTIKGAMINMN